MFNGWRKITLIWGKWSFLQLESATETLLPVSTLPLCLYDKHIFYQLALLQTCWSWARTLARGHRPRVGQWCRDTGGIVYVWVRTFVSIHPTWSRVKIPQPTFSSSRLTATSKVQNWQKLFYYEKWEKYFSFKNHFIPFYVLSHPSQKQIISQQHLCWTGGHASLSECWGTIDVVQNFGGQGGRVGMSADLKEEHVKSCPMTCTSGNSCTHKQVHFKGMAHLINACHHPLKSVYHCVTQQVCLQLA